MVCDSFRKRLTCAGMNKIRFVDGLWINDFSSYEEAINFVALRLVEKKSYFINFMYFPNFVLQKRLESYHRALVNSDYIFLDGIGMTVYTRIVYNERNILNLNGTDLLPSVLDMLNKNHHHVSIALYGSTNEVIRKTSNVLSDKYRHVNFYYFQNGYEDLNFSRLKPGSTLLIGLGTPKQECFVFENRDFFRKNSITAITVGGLFDFIGGYEKRTPNWLRSIKLEWACRTLQHPGKHIRKIRRDLMFLNILIRDYFLNNSRL